MQEEETVLTGSPMAVTFANPARELHKPLSVHTAASEGSSALLAALTSLGFLLTL